MERVIKEALERAISFDYQAICGPCCYIYWTKLGAVYVGMSGSGVHRAFSTGHQYNLHGVKDRITRVDLIACGSREGAELLEALLIDRLQPSFNCKGKGKKVKKGRSKVSIAQNGLYYTNKYSPGNR